MLRVISSKIVESKEKKKEKKKKGKFTYEGETFKTNPFAVCNKNISKKEEPAKWERCVQKVKKST